MRVVLLNIEVPEGESELPGHGAVEDEVQHAVDQGHHVHALPQWSVAVTEELLSQEP